MEAEIGCLLSVVFFYFLNLNIDKYTKYITNMQIFTVI